MALGKPSVLIAEDDDDTRELLHYQLEAAGFNVITAEDGHVALKLLNRHRPDVIVTDLMMPAIGGIGLIQRLRRRAEFADTPIIALSAHRDYSPDPMMAGATIVLRKPHDILRLVDVVTGFLPGGTQSEKTDG